MAKACLEKGCYLLDQAGDVNAAIAEFTKAIALEPTNTACWTNRGRARVQKGEVDSALSDFSEVIKLKPSSAPAHFNRANAYQSAEMWSKAADDFTKASQLAEGGVGGGVDSNHCKKQAMYCRGHYYQFEKKDMEAALSEFSKATTTYPTDPWLWRARGLAFLSVNDSDNAITNFTEAIRLNSQFYQALYLRGKTYMEKTDFVHAAADFEQTIMYAMGDAYIQNDARDLLLRSRTAYFITMKDYDSLITMYTQAITFNSKVAMYWFHRGYGYFWKSEFDKSIKDLSEAIRLQPDYADAIQQRAMAFQGLNADDKAADDYDKAATLHADKAKQDKCRVAAQMCRQKATEGKEDTAKKSSASSPPPTVSTPASISTAKEKDKSKDDDVTELQSKLSQTKLDKSK